MVTGTRADTRMRFKFNKLFNLIMIALTLYCQAVPDDSGSLLSALGLPAQSWFAVS